MNVYLDYNGKPEPISNLFWTGWQPCGCMSSVATADRGNGDYLMTAEQAQSDTRDTKAQLERAIEDGETWRLMTRDEYRALGKWGECTHVPKWGRFVAELPEGTAWATTDRWYRGRRSYRQHIVPKVEGDEAYTVRALCGYERPRQAGPWNTDDINLSDTVTCRKCEKATLS